MKKIFIVAVIIGVYYLLKAQNVDLLAGIKNIVNKAKLSMLPCSITLDDAFYQRIALTQLPADKRDVSKMDKYTTGNYNMMLTSLKLGYLLEKPLAGTLSSQHPEYQFIGKGESCSAGVSATGLGGTAIAGQTETVAGAGIGIAGLTGALSASSVALASTAILAPIGIITGIVAGIFQHHAQAMQREQNTLCAIIAPTNQSFAAIDKAFNDASITIEQANQELDNLQSAFNHFVAPITKMSNSSCNAACEYIRTVQALIEMRKEIYSSCPTDVSGLLTSEKAA